MRNQPQTGEKLTSDIKIGRIATDFLQASGKEVSEEQLSGIVDNYDGDYESMVRDLFQATGKKLDDETLKGIEKHYKLIEDYTPPELDKQSVDFIEKLDEKESELYKVTNIPANIGADNPRMPAPAGVAQVKERAMDATRGEINNMVDGFDFKPISLKEVVNTMGKGEDDIDQVSQKSKIYLEKYTTRMNQWLYRYEKKLPEELRDAIELTKRGQFDPSTLEGEAAQQYAEWERRAKIVEDQKNLNNKSIYKMNDIKRGLNNVARDAKDNDKSVKEAIVNYMKEQGISTDFLKELEQMGEFSDYDTQVTVAGYNSGKRVESTAETIWRGLVEGIDNVIGGKIVPTGPTSLSFVPLEKTTTYNKTFKREFDNFLKQELDEDVKKLMWGTNKSKYDGDIFEKTVEVNGHNIMLDEEGEAIGVRKKNGNMTWFYNQGQLDAINEFNNNKEKYLKEAYHRVNVGSASAKTIQIGTDMLPIVATTVATSGAGLPAYAGTFAGTFAVTYGDAYETQFEKTGDVGNASAYATVVSSATALLEGLGGVEGSIIQKVNKKRLWEAVDDAAVELASRNTLDNTAVYKTLGKHLVNNGLEETAIEVSQSIAEAGTQLAFNEKSDLTWKELAEIVVLTPFATGPISMAINSSDFKNFGIENLKMAAKNRGVFDKVGQEWVDSAKTEEVRKKRQEQFDVKKSLVDELANSYVAMEEFGTFSTKLANEVLDKTVEIVKKKQKIDKTKSDIAKSQYEQELAQLRSELNQKIRDGYATVKTLDERIEQSKEEIRNRQREKEMREKREKLDNFKNDPENQRLNIVPDNADGGTFDIPVESVEQFDENYQEREVDETEAGGMTVKMARLEDGKYDEAEGIVYDSEGNIVGQFTAYSDTPVEGTVEMAASLKPEAQKRGISSQTYQDVANRSGKPILPGSVSRDFGETGSSFSTNAAAFWQSMADKGVAEEVEVTTKDGSVIRTLAVLPEGFTSTDTVKRIEDAAVEESNVESEKFEQEEDVQVDLDGGTITLNRKGNPVQYKVDKFNTNENGDVVSVTVTDPNGKKKTIRSKSVIAQVQMEQMAKENDNLENTTENELEAAIEASGAREAGTVPTDGTTQNNEGVTEEEQFAEGTREDIVGDNVNYGGVEGKLVKFEDGTYNVVTPDGQVMLVEGGQSQATNAELGLTPGQTNLQATNQELAQKQQERTSIRQRLFDLFYEMDTKLPPDAAGEFVDAVNNMGGDNIVSIASGFAKALAKRIGKNIIDAVGADKIKEARDLAKQLAKLNKELSPKNVRKKRKEARIKDSLKEAKQLKAERKAKVKAARERSKANEQKEAAKQEPVKETKEEAPKEATKKTSKETQKETPKKETEPKAKETTTEPQEPVSDQEWNDYVDKGNVSDKVLEGIADHWQNGTVDKMSPRQKTIFFNNADKINQILSKRQAEGSYRKKTEKEATEQAVNIIEQRNREIAKTLKAIGFTNEQIEATIQVFGNVAKRWAKRNRRAIEEFYSDVFVGIEVKDLGDNVRGRTVKLDGAYIVELTENANVATPVHELAHIFENFLTPEEIQDVLDWAGATTWNRDVSEMFARGFEQWLQRNENADNLPAFQKFKQWLQDIYNGIVNYKGMALPTFTPDLKRIYTDIALYDAPKNTKENAKKSNEKLSKLFDKMRDYGMQFKKATFDNVLAGIENQARGLKRFQYLPKRMDRLAKVAVDNGFTEPAKANAYAAKVMAEQANNPDYLPTISVEEFIGYGYALQQMERILKETQEKLKDSPNDQSLLEMRDELYESIHNLAQVLSVARSVSGLMLGIGSKVFRKSMFDADVMKRQALERINRNLPKNKRKSKLSVAEERFIEKNAERTRALQEKFDELTENMAEDTVEQLRAIVEEMIANGFSVSPMMQEQIEKAKKSSPRKRSSDINKTVQELKNLMRDNPDILMDEDSKSNEKEMFTQMRHLISLLVASDPTIDGLIPLTNAIREFFPDMNQDKLINVLVWSSKDYQKSQAENVASSIQTIKKEGRLLDELRTYLTESFQEVERSGNKIVYPQRLNKLEQLITTLKTLAATDHTIDDESFMEAANHLEALQTLYADLVLEKVDLNSTTLEEMIDRVREYETARKQSNKNKQLKELEEILDQLNNGTYQGSLDQIIPQKNDRYTDERITEIANKIGVKKEAIKAFDEKRNMLEVVNSLARIMQRQDGGKSLKSFKDLYEAIKEELPNITEREVYDALTYNKTPAQMKEELREARKRVNDEVKALDKLQKFLEKNPPKKARNEVEKNRLQRDLDMLINNLEKAAKIRYLGKEGDETVAVPQWRMEEIRAELRQILNAYSSVLEGDVTTMTAEELVDKVAEMKEKEEVEALERKKERVVQKTLNTFRDRGLENNIFELVPDLLPKFGENNNDVKALKRRIADEVKLERLLRIERVFKILNDMGNKSGQNFKKEFPAEYAAMQRFLNIEKKSKDRKPELIALNREIYLARAAYKDWLESKYNATTLSTVKSIINTPRLLVLAGDVSFIAYQGGNMLLSHPKLAMDAAFTMAKAAFSHSTWQKQMADIKLDPMYSIAVASGLKLVDEMSLTLEEELQLTSILEKLPLGVGTMSKGFRRFSERIYSSYMNSLRMAAFRQGMSSVQSIHGVSEGSNAKFVHEDSNSYGNEKLFPDDYMLVAKGIAEDVNMHTGSASTFTGSENFDEAVNALLDASSGLFIAPRLYASVFRSTNAMTFGQAATAYKYFAEKGSVKENPMKAFYRWRFIENLRKMAALTAFHAAMLGAYYMFSGKFDDDDGDENFKQAVLNPYSTEFMKVKRGQRVFAISPFVSYYRFIGRMAVQPLLNDGLLGEDYFTRSRDMKKKNGIWSHSQDFLKYRLNPFVSAYEAVLWNRDWDGSKISEHSLFSGQGALDRVASGAKKSLAPIWIQGALDNYFKKNYWQIPGEALIDFVGVNSYTVEAYQDTEVKKYLDGKKFKLSYQGIPKRYKDREEEIKADVKREFGEWLKGKIEDGSKPTPAMMRAKNKRLVKQVLSNYN